jgi:hypothetical protein
VTRAALFSIALILAVGPNLDLLCKVWCQDATSTECRHPASTTSLNVGADYSCSNLGTGTLAFVREDGRRTAPPRDVPNAALVVLPFRFVNSSMDPRHDNESGRRLAHTPDLLIIALRI